MKAICCGVSSGSRTSGSGVVGASATGSDCGGSTGTILTGAAGAVDGCGDDGTVDTGIEAGGTDDALIAGAAGAEAAGAGMGVEAGGETGVGSAMFTGGSGVAMAAGLNAVFAIIMRWASWVASAASEVQWSVAVPHVHPCGAPLVQYGVPYGLLP